MEELYYWTRQKTNKNELTEITIQCLFVDLYYNINVSKDSQ